MKVSLARLAPVVPKRRAARRLGRGGAVAVVSAAVVALLSGPARADTTADTTTTLPLAAATDVATAGRHVFISGGPASTKIVVTSATGAVQRSIDGLGGPARLLTSRDGTTVYASLKTANAIAAINVRTLKVVATYPTGDATCPTSLAQSGRWLYFGYGCASGQWTSGLGRLDLVTGTAVLRVNDLGYYSPPLLAASGNVLVVGQPDLSPATMTSFQVSSSGSLTRVSESNGIGPVVVSNLQDLAITANGAQLFTAAGAPYVIQQYATADLPTPVKSYATTPYPVAVALSADGTFLAGGSDASYDPDVYIFKNGEPTGSIELNGPLIPGGLAWGPNSRLYAVTYDRYGTAAPILHVLTPTG